MISIENLRNNRVYNMAIFDLSIVFVFAIIVHSLLWLYPLNMTNEQKKKRSNIQFMVSLFLIYVMFLMIGTIFHRIFKVQSAFSGYLGFNNKPIR